jgi:phosphatidate phosphatase LPIN
VTYLDSGSEGEDEGGDEGKRRRRRVRTQSITSMPGSLDDMIFNFSDEDDVQPQGSGEEGEHEEHENGHEAYEDEEVGEDAFNEDFLATGEMKNVPFL